MIQAINNRDKLIVSLLVIVLTFLLLFPAPIMAIFNGANTFDLGNGTNTSLFLGNGSLTIGYLGYYLDSGVNLMRDALPIIVACSIVIGVILLTKNIKAAMVAAIVGILAFYMVKAMMNF